MASFSPTAPDIYQADPFGRFKDAYATASGIRNEQDAKAALAKYAESLYGAPQQPQGPTLADLASPPPGADSPAADKMIADSHAAATAATDPTLASYFKTNPPSPTSDYLSHLAQSESGGDPNAKNPNSSATGIYQITDGTWSGLMQTHPELGLTADGRTDPGQQAKAVKALTVDNAKALSASGQPINPGTLYAAHFLGAPTATNVLGYADNTPMATAVSPEVLQANPQLGNMTVGDFKQWAGQQGGNGQGGYRPPQAQQSAPPASAPTAASGNGLPPRDVLVSLLRNPTTRQFGAGLIQTAQSGGKLTDDQREYAGAVAQGFKGTFLDYQKELKGSGGLLNAGNGNLYDPATKTWISPPSTTPGSDNLPTVQVDPNGVPDPKQQADFLSKLDPSTASLLTQIVNYRAPIEKVTSLRGGERERIAALAAQLDPTFDMSQYTARVKTRQAFTPGGTQGQTITSANTVIGHLSNLADDAEKLGNGDFVPLNIVGNAVKSATSDKNLAKFNSDKMAVASELAKFFKGTGATDLTTTQEWQSIFDQNTGQGALKAVVSNVIGNLMKSRLDEMRSQYTTAMGKPADFRFISPETDAVLQKMGIDTSAIDPTFGSGQSAAAPADSGVDDLLKKYGQ